jgi:diguanylate cyclase (GGDEF)-like protein
MKIEEPPPIQPSRQVGIEQSVPPADATGGSSDNRRSRQDDGDAPHELHDIAIVHGVDEDDLTPNIRDAMVGLIAEVATLREALDQNRNRLAYLTTLADQDSVSQVLNRRAFVRELSRALMIAKRRGTDSSLLFIEVENLKSINTTLGLDAGDAAIEHVAGIIQSQTPEGDMVGRVGGAEFGVILIGEREDQASERAETLAETVIRRPLIWENAEVPLTLIWGTYFLTGGEDAGAVMNKADRRMRASQPPEPLS